MANEQRVSRKIRTMGALMDNRRARTPAGAHLEMSAMANEKVLLQKELARWKHRHIEIQTRLGEIAAKERRLIAVIQADQMPPGLVSPTGIAPQAADADADVPASVSGRIKVQHLSY